MIRLLWQGGCRSYEGRRPTRRETQPMHQSNSIAKAIGKYGRAR